MKILDFPHLRQTYNYDCGAKALQSVLVYFGVELREDKIMKWAHTSKQGTPIKGLLDIIEKYNLKYTSKKMTLDEVKKYIDNKIPVIVVMQAWTLKKDVDWKKDWIDGHYVTIIGYDSKKIYIEDPSSFEITYLPYDEFKLRWHDVDVDGKKFVNHGIAVYGHKHSFNPKKIIHLD